MSLTHGFASTAVAVALRRHSNDLNHCGVEGVALQCSNEVKTKHVGDFTSSVDCDFLTVKNCLAQES